MMKASLHTRMAGFALAVFAAALLTACFLAPGHFVSTLDIRKEGQFTFTYAGEIHMLPLSKMASEAEDTFTAAPCYDEDSGETRECTASETASQRKEWDDGAQQRETKRKEEAKQMGAFLGGIDPSDPKAADELAARLRRQKGWKRVDYKGNGLFDVDFAITGRIDHDFAFPTIERFPMANPFVQLALREDGSLRIDAPAFTSNPADPMRMMGMGKSGADEGDGSPPPELAGTFTITTDAAILANNTDEGPQPATTGQMLAWTIGGGQMGQVTAAPTALLKLLR